ncbi:MAG: UDP-N-acetylmuramate--L-alanine ligase [Acidimicrobiales bacterium]|nr:UDP-N-acetylmuramate--L-alanine ligase [Acidimicrobiales bacterium]
MDEFVRPDLSAPTSVHIIGIGGSGMAAIAHVLHAMGHQVSGSDLAASAAFERLVGEGVAAVLGHDAAYLGDAAVIVRSTAIPDTNPEVVEALKRGQRVHHRAEVLSAISDLKRTVAVAGTHGKTTTSSMLAVIAIEADIEPSFIIGGDVTQLGTGAAWGSGEWFIVEADESDGTFVTLGHEIGVVTNVEPDHLEHYGGEEGLRKAFVDFAAMGDTTVICADDEGARQLSQPGTTVTYGMELGDYEISNHERSGTHSFEISFRGDSLGRIELGMTGRHNVRNATAAAVTALQMGIPFEAIQRGLGGFGGVGRRLERRGTHDGILFIDDYAHLPSEVAAAIDGASDVGHDRLVVVFQPHRYSRTEAVWQDFTDRFDGADLLVITDVYASGEPAREGITGQLIVEAVQRGASPPEIIYHADRTTLADRLADLLDRGDVCLTLGAGDSVKLPDETLERLRSMA